MREKTWPNDPLDVAFGCGAWVAGLGIVALIVWFIWRLF